MKLWAISDLHVRHAVNRAAVETIHPHPQDWLILAGDLGETLEQLRFVFETLIPRFKGLIWVPGNHELWSKPDAEHRGVRRYELLVDLCREMGVLCPEDPYLRWEGEGGPLWLVPLFLLYDYSFRPMGMSKKEGLKWAAEHRIVCTDEFYLNPQPYPSREAWCEARVQEAEKRLMALPEDEPKVLINHFPLREELVRIPRVPRFRLWCGTKKTEDWHQRFGAKVVVCGHLHMRSTDWRDGVRFEEVALGYPRDWRSKKGINSYLREILPGPRPPLRKNVGPVWHR